MPKKSNGQLSPKEVQLVNYLRQDPIAFARIACNFSPNRKQAEVLKTDLEKLMKSALWWGRQFGKSSTLAVYLSHRLFARPKYTAILLAPSGDQSQLIFKKISHYYETSQFLLKYAPSRVSGTTLSVGTKEWNSTVEYVKTGLTGETARGRSIKHGVLVWDEMSSVMYPELLSGVLSPFLASQGSGEVFLSSPGEVGSYTHKLYLDIKAQQQLAIGQGREPRHRNFECRWDDTDHLSAEFVEEQRRILTAQGREWLFRREYLGEWTVTEGAFFNRDHVQSCQLNEPLAKGSERDCWIYSLDPGLDHSPSVLLIARWNPVLRRLEIVECLSMVRSSNKYVKQDEHQQIDGYTDLIDLVIELRRSRPIHRFYTDIGIEQTLAEVLKNTFRVNVVEIRIGGYAAKKTALSDLARSLANQRIVWEDQRITKQLLHFAPPKNPLTQKYEFQDKDYDIISALTQLNRYLGDRIESPYIVSSGTHTAW